MKILVSIAVVALAAVTTAVFVPPRHNKQHLLGVKECTRGPSVWCQNLTSAANCHAVKHCIQTVWTHQELPPDTSSVCQTCLDMVKQARDQLQSNETQEEIKEVFEGSCALIRIKPIVFECDKLVDQFIPELIDTLASEMNPQMVCSVAGLCNNEKIHKMIEEAEQNQPEKPDTCEGCHTVVGIMEDKFNGMSRDDVLQSLLEVCGKTSSLSDACSNIVITYFSQIYSHLKENLNANDFCLMTGECSQKFHTHANLEITPISHIGYVPIGGARDDLPCDLCEQLVSHLRDILIANTTENEFKLVLQGLCKQTLSFKDECLSLVDQYYAVIYNFLVSELNAGEICTLVGICPRNNTESVPIVPLLPIETVPAALEITPAPKPTVARINMANEGAAVRIMETPQQAQLPIDLLMPPQVLYNSQVCVFCEYFLHYLQQVITTPSSEEEIKEIIDKACTKLPRSVNASCVDFVNTYEPALVALLAQEIDPSQICPLIRACPSTNTKDVEIFMQLRGDGSKCPLCLFAVSKLEEMVKDKKTEANIKDALGKLCSRLSKNLAAECNDFVSTYTDELVEMLIADLSPQEVCVYLKLCTDATPASSEEQLLLIGGDINTNVIADNTVNGQVVATTANLRDGEDPQCVLCEFVMKEVQDQLKDNKTDEAIKKTVRGICNKLPKTIGQECDDFVNQYADTIITLLTEATEPAELCRMIHLCQSSDIAMKVEIFNCAICEALVYAIEKILDNPTVDHNVEHVLEKACRALPRKEQKECKEIIEKYGRTIYDLVLHLANKGLVCKEIGLCAAAPVRPSIEVLITKRPRRQTLVGASKCSRGPGYWCATQDNARECGNSAVKYCQDKVWSPNN